MRRLSLIILMALWTGPALANAAPAKVDALVPDAQIVGTARLTFMLWEVYDAILYAPGGQWQKTCPFALKLTYLRDLKGADIADRSVQEMRKQGVRDEVQLAAWHSQMRDIFPDVREGVSLTGICNEQGETVFLENDKPIGTIRDKKFSQRFFDIWLGEGTSEPALRKKLLGML